MLRSVIEQAGLVLFAEIALAIFVVVFVAIVIRTWLRPRKEIDDLSRLPLAPDDPAAPAAPSPPSRDRGGSS